MKDHPRRPLSGIVVLRVVLAVVLVIVLGACASGQETAGDDDAPAPAPAESGDDGTVARGDTDGDAPVEDPRSIEVVSAGRVLEPAEGRRFTNAGPVTVAPDGTIELLRNSFNASTGPAQTDVVRSTDGGDTWELVGPSIEADAAPWTDQLIMPWALASTDQGWVLFFDEFTTASGTGAIGRATAPALTGPWTVDASPVVEPGEEGSWRAAKVGTPSVVREGDGSWRMWFTATDDSLTSSIGHATSADGVTWRVDDEPVFTGAQEWDNGDVGTSQVVRIDDEYVLVYDRQSRGGGPIGIAVSDDGRSWTAAAGNPVIERDQILPGALFSTSVVAVGDELLVLQEIGTDAGGGGSRIVPVRVTVRPQAG